MKPWLRSPDLAAVILRLALGAIFITHGCMKIINFNGGTSWFPDASVLTPALQGVVAYGELICGALILLGLLTRLAAMGLVVIMIGALYYVTWQLDFATTQRVDPNYVSRLTVGNEYNYAIIAMAASLIILGAGTVSIDRLLFHRASAAPVTPRREPAGMGV